MQHGLFAMSGNVLLESYINSLIERRSPKFAKGLQTEIDYDKSSNKDFIDETNKNIDAGKIDKSKM